MKQIDHIGIAVKDMAVAEALYQNILGVEPFHRETVESQNLRITFFKTGSTKVELLNPITAEGGVYKFLINSGEGIHHVAFAVEDIYQEMARMITKGFNPLSEKPFVGALNKLVVFFHPRDTGGVLIELCQDQKIERIQ